MRRYRIFSRVLPRQESRDIGRKSIVEEGLEFFGGGMTSAMYHLRGTWPDGRDRLKSLRRAECQMGGRFDRPTVRDQQLLYIQSDLNHLLNWGS